MPSLLARLIYKVLWVLLYRERSKTSDQYIAQVIDVYESQNQPETIPAYITQDKTITTSEYSFESERTGQTWQTFTLVPKKQVKKQVCVYFHGGAWVMAGREEWKIVQKTLESDCAALFPVWTLAPLSCATEFARTSVEFITAVAHDRQWQDAEIVLAGGSAGGWCALRTLLALCEEACREEDSDYRQRVRVALGRINKIMLFNPASSLETPDELHESTRNDPMLSVALMSTAGPLWAYGATRFPSIAKAVPADVAEKAVRWGKETECVDLSDPRFSPNNGLDALRDYIQAVPDHRAFEITSFHGTADILYPSTVTLHQRLRQLGSAYAKEELVTGEGLWHGYMMFPITEAKALYTKVRQILSA